MGIKVEGTSCYRPEYLHMVNRKISDAANNSNLKSMINFNRHSEETYLEIKELRKEWIKTDEYSKNVALLDALIIILELKYDVYEYEQEGK